MPIDFEDARDRMACEVSEHERYIARKWRERRKELEAKEQERRLCSWRNRLSRWLRGRK